MFKVLIVDDESIIRKGLRNAVNWKQFDCDVCGEASDGMEGYKLISQLYPDIVITDIKMPEVDGLTMIREIKNVIPQSKVIIMTGYRDFEYAQEAIKLGAFDYLLKPTKIEELNSVIKRAVKELKFQKDRDAEFGKFKKIFEQNIPILREKLLYNIMYEISTNDTEIGANLEILDIDIGKFALIIAENESESKADSKTEQYNKHLYQFGIINSFDEVFSDKFRVVSISLDNNLIAFIVEPLGETTECFEDISSKCTYLQEIVQNCFGFTITLAVSEEGTGPLQLPEKLRECQEALEHKFYIGNNSVIFYKDLDSFFKYDDYSILEKNQKILIEGIKAGNLIAVKSKLDEIFSYVTDAAEKIGMEYLRNFYWNTISSINNIRISISVADNDKKIDPKRDIGSLYNLIQKCESIKDLNELMEEISVSVASKVNSFNNRSIKLILRKAIDYLKEHYNEQVTLNEVARNIYVSTYYISRMFKKELGKNFVDYLNEIRIEKAKELLKDVQYKAYEIAEMVGIPDAHYFSKLFKKYVGVTPTEYRELQNSN
ncbi:MAG: response regulator [Bacillota bacterium]|nr:response regulator [Bacillota bacterium]